MGDQRIIRLLLSARLSRVVVKSTGAGGESRVFPDHREPRGHAGLRPAWSLSARIARRDQLVPILAGLPAGPTVPPRMLFAKWAKGTAKPGSRQAARRFDSRSIVSLRRFG